MLYGLDASALREMTRSADRPWRRYAGPRATINAAMAAIAASVTAHPGGDPALTSHAGRQERRPAWEGFGGSSLTFFLDLAGTLGFRVGMWRSTLGRPAGRDLRGRLPSALTTRTESAHV